MKKLLCLIAIIAGIIAVTPSVSAREKSLGVRLGYNNRCEGATAGLWFEYSFNNHFRLSPIVDYYFRSHGSDALSINTNAQFPFKLSDTRGFAVYPLVGVNYTSWNGANRHDRINPNDSSGRINRFGLNVGAGLEARVSPTMKIFVEGKSTLISGHSSCNVNIGIGYCF